MVFFYAFNGWIHLNNLYYLSVVDFTYSLCNTLIKKSSKLISRKYIWFLLLSFFSADFMEDQINPVKQITN